MTQNNLANAYSDRIRGERADNLEQAIHHYSLSLEVRTRAAFPEQWASAQNNLANAYSDRIHGERADNLEQAIQHYSLALEVYSRANFPERWATTQNNLAAAYSDRIRGERADNLEQAIQHYSLALEVRTRAAFPEQWATTQNNLAAAYSDRIRGERADNLEQAIQHYFLALEVRTRAAFPEQWATIQNNLANAYSDRIRGERADNLEQAIQHYSLALEVYSRTAFPADWAMTQNNLANAYSNRIRGERADNLEQAIQHYSWALEVYSRTAFPADWAMTQNNLAAAYSDRIHGERADNLEQAIQHYSLALEVYARTAFPAEHRQTQSNLARLHFNERQWDQALDAQKRAIEAGDDLLKSAYSQTGRQAEVGETAQLYSQAAFCLVQTGAPGLGLEMLDRGKTRLLAEALALGDLDLATLPSTQRAQIETLRVQIHDVEIELRLPPETLTRREEPILLELLRGHRSTLNELVDTVRKDHLDFLPNGLSLREILALIPEDGALIAPVVTSQGCVVFLVPHGYEAVNDSHILQLPGFTEDTLQALLWGTEEKSGWLRSYGRYYETRSVTAWQAAIDNTTQTLWASLVGPIYERLKTLKITRLLLMPSSGLQLLPWHAAWRFVEGRKRTLLDEYDIVYAPSAYALHVSQRRSMMRVRKTALVAGVNRYSSLSPLHNAVPEAAAIAELFNVAPLLDATATKQAIQDGAGHAAYLHLSCHGGFNWQAPMNSALYLASDEPLSLADILGSLDLRQTRLVTLSACETGLSEVRQSPDEYLGLPAGFMQAGAPAIVSSLWTVDDRSTALLMERFYRNHLEKGTTFSAALREAQLWLRDATTTELGAYYKSHIRMPADQAFSAHQDLFAQWGPEVRPYENPFYWAAFTFSGA